MIDTNQACQLDNSFSLSDSLDTIKWERYTETFCGHSPAKFSIDPDHEWHAVGRRWSGWSNETLADSVWNM